MFKKILGKKENLESNTDIVSKMNLTEMRSYVRDEKTNEDGLVAIMNRLVKKDKNTDKYYIQPDDMDSKIKRAFDIVIELSKMKKITVVAIELIQEFTVVYDEVIKKFDKENKDIYSSRLKDAIKNSANTINRIAMINQRMKTTK